MKNPPERSGLLPDGLEDVARRQLPGDRAPRALSEVTMHGRARRGQGLQRRQEGGPSTGHRLPAGTLRDLGGGGS